MKNKIKDIINTSIEVKNSIVSNEKLIANIEQCVDVMIKALRSGNKILFCGNGGSAADAQHLAAELSGRFYLDRKALPAEALHVNTSYLTSVANDYGYEHVYSRLVDGIGQKGDILVGLSTSGNSKNISNAFLKAEEIGMLNIAMTGSHGGEMAAISNILLNMPSDDTPRIQEAHIMVGHIICELVEEGYFGAS